MKRTIIMSCLLSMKHRMRKKAGWDQGFITGGALVFHKNYSKSEVFKNQKERMGKYPEDINALMQSQSVMAFAGIVKRKYLYFLHGSQHNNKRSYKETMSIVNWIEYVVKTKTMKDTE